MLTDVFLWLGVALSLVSCLGVLVARSVYDRLHFLGPISLGAVCIAVATLVHNGFSLVGDKALLAAAGLLVCSPVLIHAAGRAARITAHGEWQVQPDEPIDVEES